MYVWIAWAFYFVLGMIAIYAYEPQISLIDALSAIVVGGAVIYMFAGGGGRGIAEGRANPPRWEDQAQATVAITLALVAFIYILATPNH
jgi:hypothetical protein